MKKSKAGIGLTEGGEQNKTKRFYLRGTLAVFCLSLAFFVFAGLFSFSPEARELFYVLSEEGCGPSQIDLSKDPKIGSAPEISIIEKMPEFAGDIFYLVFVGSCTPCHETAIKEILKSAKKTNDIWYWFIMMITMKKR